MSSNIPWISNLRFLATIAVITLHTSAVLLANYGKVPWRTGLWPTFLMRWSGLPFRYL